MINKPNIVLITTDQHRADIRKSEGYSLDVMPFLDSIAKKGVDFKKAYTSMPVCAPARTSLITGRYPTSVHVKTNPNVLDKYCMEDVYDVLNRQGYKIGLIGKDHTDRIYDHEIFDLYEGIESYTVDKNRTKKEKEFDEYRKNLKHLADHNPTPFEVEEIEPYRLTTKAIKYLEKNRDERFFLQLGIREPHNPFYVPEPYFSMFNPPKNATSKKDLSKKGEKYLFMRKTWESKVESFDNEIERTKRNYCGMLRLIDEQIQRIYSSLEEYGLLENTVIIYLSDHGDFFGEYGLIRKGPEIPEVLSRIPLIFIGPSIKAREEKFDLHVSICDIMPTICEMIGEKILDGVQGRSFLSALKGDSENDHLFDSAYLEHGMGGAYYTNEDILKLEDAAIGKNENVTVNELNSVTQAGKMRCVIKDDWKILFDMMGNGQLYNLKEDPYEINNIYMDDEYKNKKLEMLEILLGWTIRVSDDLPYPNDKGHVYKRLIY